MRQEVSIVIPVYLDFEESNEVALWLQKRESSDELRGLLEFPGGKVEQGESALFAAKREYEEEVGVSVMISDLSAFKRYSFDKIDINVFLYKSSKKELPLEGPYCIDELLSNKLKILPNNSEIIRDVSKYFQTLS